MLHYFILKIERSSKSNKIKIKYFDKKINLV